MSDFADLISQAALYQGVSWGFLRWRRDLNPTESAGQRVFPCRFVTSDAGA